MNRMPDNRRVATKRTPRTQASTSAVADGTARAAAALAPVGEATYRRVRSDILFGRLVPGQRLVLDRMRDTYGSAVGTLREVFNALASEGLVAAEGARGFEVAAISPANLAEIADVRLLLECDALRRSFEAGDVEWEGRVVAAHHKLASVERRLSAGDRAAEETFRKYDREFHSALVSACGSTLRLEMHGDIYDKYMRYLMLASVFRGPAVAREHRELLACALARDWRAAQRITTTHVEDCVRQMLAGKWWAR